MQKRKNKEMKKDMIELGKEMLNHGSVQRAIKCFSKAAKNDPEGFFSLAEMYENGIGVPADPYRAAKYERLALKLERKRRDCEMRAERKHSVFKRERENRYAWKSHRQRAEWNRHEFVRYADDFELFKAYSQGRRIRGYGRAA